MKPNYIPLLCIGALSSTTILTSCVQNIRVNPRVNLTDNDLPTLSAHHNPMNMSGSVTISSLADRVRKNNPQLRAASLKLAEAQGKIIQSGRLDNPTLGLGARKSAPGYDGDIEVSFSQRFPFTNRLSLEKRVSRDALKIAREEIEMAEQALITSAQIIAVEIIQLRKQQSHIGEQIASLETIASFIEEAAEKGELSPLDASQTRLEIQFLKNKQKQLTGEQTVLTVKLKQYIGLPTSKSLTVSGSLPSVKLPTIALSLWNRPDYRAKTFEAQYAKSNILLEKAKRYDDFELSFSGSAGAAEDAPNGTEAEAQVGMGISIPLPLYNKNEGNIKTASAKAQRNLLEKSALASEIKVQVATYRQEMLTWLNQNSEIRTNLLPIAKKNSEDLETAYKAGQGDFTSLLRSKSQTLDLQFKLLENNLKFQQARVKFYSALGAPNSAF